MPTRVPQNALISVSLISYSPLPKFRRSLNIRIDAGRKIDAHQGINRLRRRVEDVDQALWYASREIVRENRLCRRQNNCGTFFLCGQRRWASGRRTGNRLDDLACRHQSPRGRRLCRPNADLCPATLILFLRCPTSQPLVGIAVVSITRCRPSRPRLSDQDFLVHAGISLKQLRM